MSKFNHTQDNWQIERADYLKGHPFLITQGNNGFVIAEVTNQSITRFIGNESEAEANAKLIAAAPIMLDNLITAMHELDKWAELHPTDEDLPNIIGDIREAIYKATGQ